MVSYLVAAIALLSATASAASIRRQTLPCGANGTVPYTIVSGDTLGSIATRFNSGICNIASLNGIANPNSIAAGAAINIPQGCTTPDNTSCLPPATKPTATCVFGVGSTYNVRSGDTMSLIANDFNITLPALIGANPAVKNPDLIQVGQQLNVPVCPHSCCDWIGTYTIVKGDTFFDLAGKFGTTTGQIKAVNQNVDPLTIPIGAQIILPKHCKGRRA
ncbi:carbohydrate-binding module family 50 protein [Plenodomus tracheiphilus IPT5]|uniref:Carbohydrate-binding module family 50 protein n=1 Tax=Plenodomus tracheiphilus IPT5 TaxID=1408161 RepID=A0A6A7BCF6_9PLEO|nr:carbohydrate-binding module family 50 protein [Plenodomus tracheiphilus IPT5]